jgi:cell wall-associated NlpC family hydrolase
LSPSAAAEVAFLALSLVDTPYTWGGNTPQGGFDCSGLIVYAFRNAAGIELPRTVAQMARVGVRIPEAAARTGDLVFFHTAGPYSHAGIYVGESRFVHAPATGGLVRLDGMALRYWRTRLAEVRRI